MGHDAVCSYDAVISYGHARQNTNPLSKPDTFSDRYVLYCYILRRIPSFCFRIHSVIVIGDEDIRRKECVITDRNGPRTGDPAPCSDSNMSAHHKLGVQRSGKMLLVDQKLAARADQRVGSDYDSVAAL